jgi:hypothetical protein
MNCATAPWHSHNTANHSAIATALNECRSASRRTSWIKMTAQNRTRDGPLVTIARVSYGPNVSTRFAPAECPSAHSKYWLISSSIWDWWLPSER